MVIKIGQYLNELHTDDFSVILTDIWLCTSGWNLMSNYLMESISSSFISVTVPVFVKTQLHTNVQMLWMQTTWCIFASRPIGEVYMACIIHWYYFGTVGQMSVTWTIIVFDKMFHMYWQMWHGDFIKWHFHWGLSMGNWLLVLSTNVIQVARCGCEAILRNTEDVWFVVGETISYLVVTVIHKLLGILFHVSWICWIWKDELFWEHGSCLNFSWSVTWYCTLKLV